MDTRFKRLSPLTESTFYILLSLIEPLHGYGIIKKVDEMSKGRLRLAAGTLYGALSSLISNRLIVPAGEDRNNPRRKYASEPILKPEKGYPYELDDGEHQLWVPGVIYSCGAILDNYYYDEEKDEYILTLDVYYSGSDTAVLMARVKIAVKYRGEPLKEERRSTGLIGKWQYYPNTIKFEPKNPNSDKGVISFMAKDIEIFSPITLIIGGFLLCIAILKVRRCGMLKPMPTMSLCTGIENLFESTG